MGVGYDASDGTLWCGNNPDVDHYDTAGNLLGSFNAGWFFSTTDLRSPILGLCGTGANQLVPDGNRV